MLELDLRHTFSCSEHGLFYKNFPLDAPTPAKAICPSCDAGLYGYLGGVIIECNCCTKKYYD